MKKLFWILSFAIWPALTFAGIVKSDAGIHYVLSIGVNQSQADQRLTCKFCDSDARALVNRLSLDTTGGQFSMKSYLLTNEEATWSRLNAIFTELATITRSQDKLIVYYSGVSHKIKRIHGNAFLLNGAQLSGWGDSMDVSGDYFTIDHLRVWLDKIAAGGLLFISDAGPTETYIQDFLSNLSKIESTWSKLDQKQRVFLYPRFWGQDNYRTGRGYFSEIITETWSGYSLFDLLNTGKREKVYSAIRQREMQNYRPESSLPLYSVQMFVEQDFLKDYSWLLQKGKRMSRGGEIEDEHADTIRLERAPRRIALVIGVDRYDHWDKLLNPAFDANTIADILEKKYGYETWRLTGYVSYDSFIDKIYQLKQTDLSGPMDQLFVFFAGHGFFDPLSSTGHLITSDSKSGERPGDTRGMIQHNYLINTLNGFKVKHILLMADACYSGALQQASGPVGSNACDFKIPLNWKNLYAAITTEQFIQRKMSCPTRKFITSGGKDYKVPDGADKRHSPFAAVFIDLLKNGDSKDKIVSFTELLPNLDYVNPMPVHGRFGTDSQESDYLFIETRQ